MKQTTIETKEINDASAIEGHFRPSQKKQKRFVNIEKLTPFSASLRPIEYQMHASQCATSI